jgi:hypothetical protein
MHKNTTEISEFQQSGDSESKLLATVVTAGSVGDGARFSVFVEGRVDGSPSDARFYEAHGVFGADGGSGQCNADERDVAVNAPPSLALSPDGDLKLLATYTDPVTVNWKIRVTVESFG